MPPVAGTLLDDRGGGRAGARELARAVSVAQKRRCHRSDGPGADAGPVLPQKQIAVGFAEAQVS
jgi:hypothetical protein